MMNALVKGLLFVLLIAGVTHLAAQQKSSPGEKKIQSSPAGRKILYPSVYLGSSDFAGGAIRKTDFDRLLKQGLTSKDSLGNRYKVVGFEFNYFERQLYEDSIGNLKVMTDVLSEYCTGDTVSGNVAFSIYQRTKPGDTVYIDRVQVARYTDPAGTTANEADPILAKVLKAYIVK